MNAMLTFRSVNKNMHSTESAVSETTKLWGGAIRPCWIGFDLVGSNIAIACKKVAIYDIFRL